MFTPFSYRLVRGPLSAVILMLVCGSALAQDDSLTIVLTGEPTSLDACDDSTIANGRVMRGNVVEPLVRIDPVSSELVSVLARDWTSVDDNTWLFTLRPGVTFHDGAPLDAEAAVYGINRAMQADLVCQTFSLFPTHTEAFVEDDMVVRIVTDEADPILPVRLSNVGLPSPTTSLTEKSTSPVGTGPYTFVSREVGQSIVLEAYADYWGESPDFQRATYVFRSEPTIRASMIRTGEADLALDIPFYEAEGYEYSQDYSTNGVFYLRPMVQKPPFDDVRVREAVAAAIDKELLTEILMDQAGLPTAQLVSPLINAYIPDYAGASYDPDHARQLLEAASADGVPVDTEVTLVSRTDLFAGVDEVNQAIEQMLQQAGFNVSLLSVDSVAWSPWARKPDSLTQPVNLLTSAHTNFSGDGSLTFPNMVSGGGRLSVADDSVVNDLLDQAAVASVEERGALYQEAAMRAYQEHLVVPVALLQSRLMTSANVEYEANGFTNGELHLAAIKRRQ